MAATHITLLARHGLALHLPAHKTIKVMNTYGTQVVDTWAFTLSPDDSTIATQLSMQHTHASLNRLMPRVGDGLYSNRREKMLTLTEDTTSGVHDTLIAACDQERYVELMGSEEEGRAHRNCSDNLGEGLALLVHKIKPPQFTPSPLNLFMNIPVHEDRKTLSFEAPTSKEGEYVCLRAEMDLIIAFSACPQDILKINCGKPVDVHMEIL